MIRPASNWETARLVARPAVASDAQVVFDEYAQDAGVARFMTWRPHRDVGETIEFLQRCERVWADGSAFPWTLWLKDGGEFAGVLELRVRAPAVDIGYALASRWWRQGLMTEGVREMIGWALDRKSVV